MEEAVECLILWFAGDTKQGRLKLEFWSPLGARTIPPVPRTGRPPRMPNTSGTCSRSCGKTRELVVQWEFFEAWKNDQSVIPDGQRGGMQSASAPAILHSWLCFYQEVGLNDQRWAGRHHEVTFQTPGVCKPGLITFAVSWSQPRTAVATGQIPSSPFSTLPWLWALVKWAEEFNS